MALPFPEETLLPRLTPPPLVPSCVRCEATQSLPCSGPLASRPPFSAAVADDGDPKLSKPTRLTLREIPLTPGGDRKTHRSPQSRAPTLSAGAAGVGKPRPRRPSGAAAAAGSARGRAGPARGPSPHASVEPGSTPPLRPPAPPPRGGFTRPQA